MNNEDDNTAERKSPEYCGELVPGGLMLPFDPKKHGENMTAGAELARVLGSGGSALALLSGISPVDLAEMREHFDKIISNAQSRPGETIAPGIE